MQIVSKHCLSDAELFFSEMQALLSAERVHLCISPGCLHFAICKLNRQHLGFCTTLNTKETTHPDAVFIVAGDFNHCDLRNVLPTYQQHVNFPTREKNILDYNSEVTSYISICSDNIVPTYQIRTYPNQKTWINCEVSVALMSTQNVLIDASCCLHIYIQLFPHTSLNSHLSEEDHHPTTAKKQ